MRNFLIATAIVIGLALAWAASDLLLLVFASVLLAVLLRTWAGFVARHTPLGPGWSLAMVVILLAGLGFLGGWLVAPNVAAQAQVLSEKLPEAFGSLKDWLARYPVLSRLGGGNQVMGRLFSSTLGAVGNVVIVLFAGLYLAADSGTYKSGLVRLVPPPRRKRASEILDEIGRTLRLWLLGKLAGMLFVAVATVVGLSLLGAPLAFSLGILAGLLDFIPNIGPLVALIPAAALAFVQDPILALWVAVLYIGVQTVESYILVPQIQRRNISLAPALIICWQVFCGLLLGGLGLLVATPLLAAAQVLVRELYLRRIES